MPQIAELREIDGQMWARIPVNEYDGVVSLYSEAEVQKLRRDTALAIIDQIHQEYPKPGV